MRRPPVLVLILAVIAAMLGFASTAAAVDSAPAPTATPAIPASGQTFTLTGNIGTALKRSVELQRDDSGTWNKYKSGTTTSSGVYSFTAQTTEPTRIYRVHAPASGNHPAVDTEPVTINPTPPPPAAPTGPVKGSLTESPTTYSDGDAISLAAKFPNGTFPITLYKEGPADTWTAVSTKTSNSSGDATFTGFAVTTATQRVFARKANDDRTEIDAIAPSPRSTLSIRRDCPTNQCGPAATASGTLDPVEEGRMFTLQRQSGSSWVTVGTNPTGADGKVQIPFSLSGVPQWTTRTYRLTSAATESSPATTSLQIQFMPGPTQLGTNVLRVDVDKGIYPVDKGPEYTGVATLSVNGTPVTNLDHVALENFGVRGHSTATLVKKPYKLKFLKKPPSGTTVFGMPRSKSWTLLAQFKDGSLMREKIGLDLGITMDHIAWTPQSRFVEMFVNDQYRGSYLMNESVKIDSDRVDVDDTNGMIMETDGLSVIDSTLGFMSTIGKNVFAFKDPDKVKDGGADQTGVTPAKLQAIKDRINLFESKLYSSTPATRNQYPDYLDTASAIDFNLLREFAKSGDAAFWRSSYFSWDPTDPTGTVTPDNPLDDNKFHFGPVWDFDGSAGNACCDSTATYAASPQGWMMRGTGTSTGDRTYKTQWFVQLFKDQMFGDAVKARWAEVKAEFQKTYLTETAALKTQIGPTAENDRNRWPSSTRPRKSRGTYNDEVAFLTKWYKDRYAWMDQQLNN